MKKAYYIFLMICAAVLSSCESYPVYELPQMETLAVTDITTTTAVLHATMTNDVIPSKTLVQRGFRLSEDVNFDGAVREYTCDTENVLMTEDNMRSFSLPVTDLAPGTTYYVRVWIDHSNAHDQRIYGNTASFTTEGQAQEDKTITLKLSAATNITANTADMKGTITIGKDAVGTITECGFICAQDPQPTMEASLYHYWRFNSSYNSNFNTWKGTIQLSGTVNKLKPNMQYYYRMYYQIGDVYYYDTDIRTFTTPHSPTYTVAQVMAIYNNLNLPSGVMSDATYTVRGYVTKWYSGYPDFPNAQCWIDDSANGSTSLLQCYRLTGVNPSDQRTLVVGDYIEAQDCYLKNYNGKAELVNGTFTVLQAAPTPLDEILGTYMMSAKTGNFVFYETTQDVTWYGIRIIPYGGGNGVKVIGLYQGNSNYVAYGTYDSSTKKLTLRKTTNEELPSFSYYSSSVSQYYTVTAKFSPIEWGLCGECGVWSGSTIPMSSAESGDFVLTSAGRLEQGKSTVSTSNTWYFDFGYYSAEDNSYITSTTYTYDVVLTRTSTNY